MRVASAPLLAAMLSLAATSALAAGKAPEPVGGIEADRFFNGAWREIARMPSRETLGCLGAQTTFGRDAAGAITSRETCRLHDAAQGQVRVASGTVKILNPGTNTKFQVTYQAKGPFKPRSEYWVLDSGQNWFIAANPAFTSASIYTRTPQPDQQTKDLLANRLKALGFDTRKLEWPDQPPA